MKVLDEEQEGGREVVAVCSSPLHNCGPSDTWPGYSVALKAIDDNCKATAAAAKHHYQQQDQ